LYCADRDTPYRRGTAVILFDFQSNWLQEVVVRDTTRLPFSTDDGRDFVAYTPTSTPKRRLDGKNKRFLKRLLGVSNEAGLRKRRLMSTEATARIRAFLKTGKCSLN
jgi:hypothetical protein